MAFKEQEETNQESQNEDNFGLPDLEYKPLDQLEENNEQLDTPVETASASSETPEQKVTSESVKTAEDNTYIFEGERKSSAPLIIGIIIALIVALSGFLIYYYVIQPNQEKEKQAQLTAKAEKEKRDKEAAQRLREEEERKIREAEEAAANAKPAVGNIETLTAPTRRYYVVVASAVDVDLLTDYAKKLSAKGVSSKIIPPFGKTKFSRIAISDHDTFAAGQNAADAAKTEYGNDVWVIRY